MLGSKGGSRGGRLSDGPSIEIDTLGIASSGSSGMLPARCGGLDIVRVDVGRTRRGGLGPGGTYKRLALDSLGAMLPRRTGPLELTRIMLCRYVFSRSFFFAEGKYSGR